MPYPNLFAVVVPISPVPARTGARCLLLLLLLLACKDPDALPLDPDEYPYRVEEVFDIGGSGSPQKSLMTVNLENDGRTEVLILDVNGTPPITPPHISLQSSRLETIDQINFPGHITGVTPLDYDSDGVQDLFVTYVHNDSLFVSVIDAGGKRRFYFVMATGKPRQEDSGFYHWDPGKPDMFLEDIDHDGDKELVSVISTGYARAPSGIMAHSLPDGNLLAQHLVGAASLHIFSGDFDGDDHTEYIMSTRAPKNGASVGGFDDEHTYLIVFELPDLEITWSRQLGGVFADAMLFYVDMTGDGRKEFALLSISDIGRSEQTRMELIEPGTWNTFQYKSFPLFLQNLKIRNLDADPQP